ncbi:MAG: type II toxin-antitoxin system prevent-host-death family antitoxin [Methylorubrum populi]
MTTIPLEALEPQLQTLVRRVERGETIVVTRDGKPIFDLVPRQRKGGIDFEAGQAFLRQHGITNPFPSVADDFDDPLPEDFLIRPLPEA